MLVNKIVCSYLKVTREYGTKKFYTSKFYSDYHFRCQESNGLVRRLDTQVIILFT